MTNKARIQDVFRECLSLFDANDLNSEEAINVSLNLLVCATVYSDADVEEVLSHLCEVFAKTMTADNETPIH